ncbi:MAG: mcp [Proteobacteria bacterium]|nr:mcp [Pseudomonadota bacterium]
MNSDGMSRRPDLRAVSDQLEAARSRIEERFVEGGRALMAAYDIVARLLAAIEGVTGALDDHACDEAAARLTATLKGLTDLVEAEAAAGQRLASILADGEAITPRTRDMQRSLRYLTTCAMETRIAGAGVSEFAQFADDVDKYVGSAIGQIDVFAAKVGELSTQLAAACAGGKGNSLEAQVSAVSSTLIEALEAVHSRRAGLRRLAAGTADVARSVQEKVGKVLSALQVGDVARQQIEHVQAGIAILLDELARCDSERQADALNQVAIRLLTAQTSAMIKDFTEQTRVVVASIEGLAGEAERVLALNGKAGCGSGETMQAIEEGVSLARSVVGDIERSGMLAAAAYAATKQVANELLSNMGNIGNIRSVRDDIRCLAINAYLRSNRLGAKGRAVGVVAAEMNTYAARLGVAAEDILQRLSTMRETAAGIDADNRDRHVNIVSEVDGAVATLREATAQTNLHLKEASESGNAIAERIGHIARDIDFAKDLGERLEACRRLFGSDGHLGLAKDAEEHARFSERLLAVYTMAAERDIHRAILGSGNAPALVVETKESEDLFDDVLF